MTRGQQVNERMRKVQRSRILDAAGEIFARKGLAATMDDVAAEAGVSHGLAYRYFASKEAIPRTLVKQALQAPEAELQGIQDMPGTVVQRLQVLIGGFVKSRREHPEFYQLLDHVLNEEEMPDDFRKLLRKRRRALRAALRQLIVEGQAVGDVAGDDPDQLARAVFTCMDGLTGAAVYDSEQYGEHFPEARIFLRMLKP